MSFFSKYFFLIVWVVAILVAGAFFIWFVNANNTSQGTPAPQASTPTPAGPTVTATVTTSTNGNSLTVTWNDLPSGTTAINIYRSKIGQNKYTLWKTVAIDPDQLSGGQTNVDLGSDDENQYQFYFQAVSGSNGGGTVLWTSSPTGPSGTPEAPPTGGGGGTPSPTPSPSPIGQTPTPSPVAPNPSPTPSSPTPTSPSPSPTPAGTPYYNPQVQISGYGQGPTGNFWVQHVDQKIQIGWQDLPADTTSIVIYRSPNQDGPWTQVLTEEKPGVTGSYSIQVVDDTLGQAYYYEMQALDASATLATYGPVLLSPQ